MKRKKAGRAAACKRPRAPANPKPPPKRRGKAAAAAKIYQPHFIDRCLEKVSGARHERRPSTIARKGNKRRSSEILVADTFDGSADSWAADVEMPAEKVPDDAGWLPGPIVREIPQFKGPKPGPTSAHINHDSSEVAIMHELLTSEFKERCRVHTISHIQAHRADLARRYGDVALKGVEAAFGEREDEIFGDTAAAKRRFELLFDTWLAAMIRVAHLKPEVPKSALWGCVPECSFLHNFQLDNIITWRQFQFCNKHMSFADTEGSDKDSDVLDDSDVDDDVGSQSDGEEESSSQDAEESAAPGDNEQVQLQPVAKKRFDTFRKRRELTDIANRAFAAAYNPNQHLGLDEGTRATKHWEKIRIRFKASVHSGTLVDMLNDCKTSYCLWFEEQTWLSTARDGPDVHTITARLKRAAACLVAKQCDEHKRSTANYCISLDRGYGHVQAQERLWLEDGVHSNAMIQANRVGLPREFIDQVKKDLGHCPSKCSHKPDSAGCRKYLWTAVHRPPFELSLWMDSKLILCYGNFFSCSRAGLLTRGSTGSRDSYSLWAPENTWHYNIEGRSATDSADQARKKLSLAERRIQRAGHKGIAFVFDIAFSNGAAMQRMLQPQSMSRAQLDNKFTKVLFCQRWCNSILEQAAKKPFRTYRLPVTKTHGTSPSDSLSHLRQRSTSTGRSAAAVVDMDKQHTLIDLYKHYKGEEMEQAAVKKRGRPKNSCKGMQRSRGYCGTVDELNKFQKCQRSDEAQRTPLFCQCCKRFYHLPCFFESHFCVLMK